MSDSAPDTSLAVYLNDDGSYWVVAHSADDAQAVFCEFTGERPEDYADQEWLRQDDEDHLTLFEGDDRTNERRQAHREWAEENGRGFLCSTEY